MKMSDMNYSIKHVYICLNGRLQPGTIMTTMTASFMIVFVKKVKYNGNKMTIIWVLDGVPGSPQQKLFVC